MKKAVPPTIDAASSPMISTTETTTAMTVFLVLASISRGAPPHSPARGHSFDQSSRFVGIYLVIIAFAQRDRRLEFGPGGRLVSRFQLDASELEMSPALDPFPAFECNRPCQIRFG